MWRRNGSGALVMLALVAGGCGKGEGPADGGAKSGAPVQLSIPTGDPSGELGPDNIQAEIDGAGAGVKFVKIDLSPAGVPLTMDAPEGAKVKKIEKLVGDRPEVEVSGGDRFAVHVRLGKDWFLRNRQQMAAQKLLVSQKDFLLGESTLLLAARCEFARHVVLGRQDYSVENIDPVFGRQVNHSRADCLLMLKCVATLAPKAPLPDDPAAALRQLGAVASKGADGQTSGLRLAPHQTTDATLELLAKVDGLRRVDLSRCPITDDGLPHLAGLTGLRELNLSDCGVTDAGLSSLAALTELEVLNLTSSFGDAPQIKGPGLAALSGMTKLRVLVLDKNLVDDAALAHLKGLKSLRELYLEQTRVVGPGLAALKDLTGLTLLSLSDTKVTDAGLEGLGGMTALEVLNLHGTLVTGEGIKRLHGLKALNTLNLGGTPLSDAGLADVAGLTGLKRLVLEGTRVTDDGLEHLKGMKGLRQVALAGTKVTKAGADKLRAALPGVEVSIE